VVRVWRWFLVIGGVLILGALPPLIRVWPAPENKITATDLLYRISGSRGAGYSGYAEATGGLALPITRQFNSVADLFGGLTQMRVWWRAADDWRLDTITLSGETDVYQSAAGTWTWDYESNLAVNTESLAHSPIRFPVGADLLPPTLAARLLSAAAPDAVSRIGSRRVAGVNAAGLRLRPGNGASTIGHVDVWADALSGIPLRVDVYGKGTDAATLSSVFLDFTASRPAAAGNSFLIPAGANIRADGRLDVAAAIDRLGRGTPPDHLAGMAKNDFERTGSIGVYGQGISTFAAVPLPDRIADSLRDQLATAPGVTVAPVGSSISAGPLTLLVGQPGPSGVAWLLTGTVTLATLIAASAELGGPS